MWGSPGLVPIPSRGNKDYTCWVRKWTTPDTSLSTWAFWTTRSRRTILPSDRTRAGERELLEIKTIESKHNLYGKEVGGFLQAVKIGLCIARYPYAHSLTYPWQISPMCGAGGKACVCRTTRLFGLLRLGWERECRWDKESSFRTSSSSWFSSLREPGNVCCFLRLPRRRQATIIYETWVKEKHSHTALTIANRKDDDEVFLPAQAAAAHTYATPEDEHSKI